MSIAQVRRDIAKDWRLSHLPRTRIVHGVKIRHGLKLPRDPKSTHQWCKVLSHLQAGDSIMVDGLYHRDITSVLVGLGIWCSRKKCGDLYQYTIVRNPYSSNGISISALARLVEQSIYRARYISRLRRILERELLSSSQRVLARILIDHPEVTNAEEADLAIVDKANQVAQFLLGEGATWKDLKGKKIVQQRGNRKPRISKGNDSDISSDNK